MTYLKKLETYLARYKKYLEDGKDQHDWVMDQGAVKQCTYMVNLLTELIKEEKKRLDKL